MSDNQELDVIVETNTSLEQIERAQYDVAVATAHKYPRNIERFIKEAVAVVKLDQETAEACIFRRPVGKKDGREEYAEGLSVRMAEIVAAFYGNIVYGSMIIEQTDRFVKARGQARDIQRNVTSSCEVVESTVTKNGQPFSERMRIVVAKSALSKARRDALFQVVPRALCKPIESAARQVITGSQKPLSERRAAVVSWIAKTSIAPARVWSALGITNETGLNDDELLTLQGIRTAIKDGEMTIDEAFPSDEKAEPKTSGLEAFAKKPKAEAKPKLDNVGLLTAALESKGFTVAQFTECLIADGKLDPKDAAGIVDVASIPKAVIEHYVDADGQCSEAIRSMDFVIENAKQ